MGIATQTMTAMTTTSQPCKYIRITLHCTTYNVLNLTTIDPTVVIIQSGPTWRLLLKYAFLTDCPITT